MSPREGNDASIINATGISIVLIVPPASTLAVVLAEKTFSLPRVVEADMCIVSVVECNEAIAAVGH